jgi:hypothetical protein
MHQEALFDPEDVDLASNTPARLPLTGGLSGQDERMAGSNAGKKRNVFARRDPNAWHPDMAFSSYFREQVDAAAEESGNLSPAAFLELFVREYIAEHGSLPAVPATLFHTTEVSSTAAA